MTGLTVAQIRAARAAVERRRVRELRDLVRKKAADATVGGALALEPRSRASRLSDLFALVTGSSAQRLELTADIVVRLRAELPAVLDRLPVTLGHLGFRSVDELAQFLGEALLGMHTSAETRAAFAAGVDGWRWNLVGRVLFERLVKRHPRLQRFFTAWARDWLRVLNSPSRVLVNLAGNRVTATGRFGRLRKVDHFLIEGADGVERASVDFGFLADDGRRHALLPIEIKLPGALAGVAGQFAEFVPRLRAAKTIVAMVDDGNGKLNRVELGKADLVFLQGENAQLAVAPLTRRRAVELLGEDTTPGDVAAIADLDQSASRTHDLAYYRARIAVDRAWLEKLVRPVTDSPQP